MVTIEKGDEVATKQTDKPLDVLREIMKDYKAPRLAGLPPFAGGFVGYFAYAMIGYAEPTLNIKKGMFNDYDMMLFDKVIAYDHLTQKISVIVNINQQQNHLRGFNHVRAGIHAAFLNIAERLLLCHMISFHQQPFCIVNIVLFLFRSLFRLAFALL